MNRPGISKPVYLLIGLMFISGCGSDCAKPSNPFPGIQYVFEAGNVDGIFIHSVEWLNIQKGVSADTFRIAARAVLFDQPGGNTVKSGAVMINGRSTNLSSDGSFSLDLPSGSLGSFVESINWQISNVPGHDNFSQEFTPRRPQFVNLNQGFSDFRTNSDFFVSMDRAQTVDESYVFICGPEGTITTAVNTSNPGSGYTPQAFNTTGIGNALIQGTNRFIDLISVGSKTYAIIFQNSVAYHTEIIEGNEPKCED